MTLNLLPTDDAKMIDDFPNVILQVRHLAVADLLAHSILSIRSSTLLGILILIRLHNVIEILKLEIKIHFKATYIVNRTSLSLQSTVIIC